MSKIPEHWNTGGSHVEGKQPRMKQCHFKDR